ncbi:MAG: GTP 3',8-cyclase MoaA [Alphaproteobacteria bacterium]|nr:GTP 3',8-cyclase MoaA [Alphaproteobacteria bacterium]MDA7999883.1 GTP 3',8-cyclase MoaA [Alphaproteobacteria bacterium]MDA8003332.1 GTP 3',8-cyclase MoaA [Alphaproteobacteria bacterium]MDA8005343.1 GTP 3',8-cyclase MoaA [Alphaproteobacteria bacterium]MDA8012617.1 GTP 3',8-cyclase MoaA [Alphaproteobacteria bacterium]
MTLLASAAAAPAPLVDPHGRRVSYLRLSVTDRCDFRCSYCMPENVAFLPKRDVLSLEELDAVARAFVRLGVSKLRITGGEPLVRRNVLSLFQSLGGLVGSGLRELTLTTNGSQLGRLAVPLYGAGVRRVNVSLDTLDPGRFGRLTRTGHLQPVLDGLAAAKAARLKVKINAVVIKDFNEDELLDLVRWCGARDFDITFIEVMPLGELTPGVRLSQYLSLAEVRRRLGEHLSLVPADKDTGGPSRYYFCEETGGNVGFIAPMTGNFCDNCNRVRVTCTGTLYPCLGQNTARSLRDIVRADPTADSPELEAAIRGAVARKPKGHDFALHHALAGAADEVAVSRSMNTTGG